MSEAKQGENWQEVGAVLEKLCERGYFPGIGYDANGWEAWVFFDAPVQGEHGRSEKAYGHTATEAIVALKDRMYDAGLWEDSP